MLLSSKKPDQERRRDVPINISRHRGAENAANNSSWKERENEWERERKRQGRVKKDLMGCERHMKRTQDTWTKTDTCINRSREMDCFFLFLVRERERGVRRHSKTSSISSAWRKWSTTGVVDCVGFSFVLFFSCLQDREREREKEKEKEKEELHVYVERQEKTDSFAFRLSFYHLTRIQNITFRINRDKDRNRQRERLDRQSEKEEGGIGWFVERKDAQHGKHMIQRAKHTPTYVCVCI